MVSYSTTHTSWLHLLPQRSGLRSIAIALNSQDMILCWIYATESGSSTTHVFVIFLHRGHRDLPTSPNHTLVIEKVIHRVKLGFQGYTEMLSQLFCCEPKKYSPQLVHRWCIFWKSMNYWAVKWMSFLQVKCEFGCRFWSVQIYAWKMVWVLSDCLRQQYNTLCSAFKLWCTLSCTAKNIIFSCNKKVHRTVCIRIYCKRFTFGSFHLCWYYTCDNRLE